MKLALNIFSHLAFSLTALGCQSLNPQPWSRRVVWLSWCPEDINAYHTEWTIIVTQICGSWRNLVTVAESQKWPRRTTSRHGPLNRTFILCISPAKRFFRNLRGTAALTSMLRDSRLLLKNKNRIQRDTNLVCSCCSELGSEMKNRTLKFR